MSKCNAQQLLQDGSCFLCLDAGIRQVLELQLLCEILNNGIGGGGSGVTGDGTLFPATSQTTLTLNSQSANLIFAGPGSGAAAKPTFRAMVTADLGTTLTPQFARLGLGTAADASVPLFAEGANLGAGVTSIVGRFDCPTSNPTALLGAAGNNTGALLSYDKGNNLLFVGVYGAVGIKVKGDGTFFCDSTCEASGFIAGGSAGVTNTFNGSNTVTVVGGLVVGIA